ncbi:MAG: hypothetical protein AAB462_04530 [Patescibacteria group bacterium]
MAFGGEKHVSEPSPFERLDNELPIKYTLPFDWGLFKITEDAYEQYGLTPLVEGFKSTDVPLESESFAKAVIRVVGPSELPEQTDPTGEFYMQATRDKTVRVDTGFRNPSTFIRSMVDGQIAASGVELDDDQVEELRDRFEGYKSQILIHTIAESVSENINSLYIEMIQREQKAIALRSSAVVLGGVAAVSSVAGHNMLKASKFSKTGNSAALIGALGVGAYGMKKIMDSLGGSERIFEVLELTDELADFMGFDIYDAFSTDRFDERFSEIAELGEADSDDTL